MTPKDQVQADAKTMAPGTSSSTLVEGNSTQDQHTHKEGFFKRMAGHLKPSGDSLEHKKQSISDSSPFIFAFDPNTGKEVLKKNPHWPNEDSWKQEEANKGQWAFGSMDGQQNKDFGGTVG